MGPISLIGGEAFSALDAEGDPQRISAARSASPTSRSRVQYGLGAVLKQLRHPNPTFRGRGRGRKNRREVHRFTREYHKGNEGGIREVISKAR
jgi:hypothetical protein